jgi:hypothetical protein
MENQHNTSIFRTKHGVFRIISPSKTGKEGSLSQSAGMEHAESGIHEFQQIVTSGKS